MAAMGGMGVPIPGAELGPEAVAMDMGGMGVPPAVMDPNEMMLQALTAVLGKWESTDAQIAGEKNSLMETLMLIASANPPGAQEAAVMGGDPSGYGMEPGML